MSWLKHTCFGGLFQKRCDNLDISGPLDAPARVAQTPITAQPSTAPRPSAMTSPIIRKPSSARTPIKSAGMKSPEFTTSPVFPPPVYDTTNSAYKIPVHHAHKSSVSSLNSQGHPRTPKFQEAINMIDEKPSFEKHSTDLLRSPRSPEFPTHFDTTPRFQKMFKIFSSQHSKIEFTQAVKPAPAPEPEPAPEPTSSLPRKISQRFSRMWTHPAHHHNQSSGQGRPQNEKSKAVPPVPRVPVQHMIPRNGLAQCLTTRLPNGDVKPVTMVPKLTLDVPTNVPSRKATPTPMEASPIHDPWRFTQCEIQGLSDKSQAWML